MQKIIDKPGTSQLSTDFEPDTRHEFLEIFVYRTGAEAIEEGFAPEDLPELLADEQNIVWVDLRGETPEEVEGTRKILLDVFKFNPLSVEDCIETRTQPKIEGFPEYLYLIVHGIKPEETSPTNFVTKDLDAFLGRNYVVTFHRQRFRSIRDVKHQIRKSPFAFQRGAAYVLHQILDHIVDYYMPIVEDFDKVIGRLEGRIFDMRRMDNAVLEDLMDLRRAVARLRRISTRQLEVLYRISHGEFPQIPETILPFFRDVHDHLQRTSDLAENFRELVSGLFDIHFSVVANRTNDVMKTLAVVSAIILPLSLIAGIYGMNFEYMPELRTRNGYFVTLGLMALLAVGLLFYFWKRGWIFQGDEIASTDKPDENE